MKQFQIKVLEIYYMYNSYSETATTINDYVSNLKIATIIGSKNFLFNKFNIEQINLIKNIDKQYLINLMYSGLNSVINIINEIIVIAICGMLIISSEATLGMLMVFTTYSSKVRGAILSLTNSNIEYKRAIVMLKRIFSVLDEKMIEKIGDKTSNCIIEGEIEFKDVEFKYESGKQILNGLNLNIKSNSCVGIVGVSGAGKSTLINLLFRLWDVNKGKIMIDGKNINSYSLEQLRSQYSVISQDIQLYNDTIMNNLVLDNKDIVFEEVKRACIKAGIYEYINKLPDGFESIIGENGTKLSGGQKQRISIARAILKNSPILILDEATAALDNISEQKVINNLLAIFKHKTTIIITHNLSTLSKCDNIYVLENGKVIESGTHNELRKNENLYQKLIDVSLSW